MFTTLIARPLWALRLGLFVLTALGAAGARAEGAAATPLKTTYISFEGEYQLGGAYTLAVDRDTVDMETLWQQLKTAYLAGTGYKRPYRPGLVLLAPQALSAADIYYGRTDQVRGDLTLKALTDKMARLAAARGLPALPADSQLELFFIDEADASWVREPKEQWRFSPFRALSEAGRRSLDLDQAENTDAGETSS